MFKHLIHNLESCGHKIKITINSKDVLEQLLIEDNVRYENILPYRRSKNHFFSSLMSLLLKDLNILKLLFKNDYEMMIGTETALSHIGWLFRKPVFIMVEDDISVIRAASLASFPLAKYIVSPLICNLGKWNKKKIAYNGYQKIAYLHPDYFKPNIDFLEKSGLQCRKFFIIRVSGLSAYHDKGIYGLTEEIIFNTIQILKSYGTVVISSERKLSEYFAPFQIKLEVSKIHHYLYFAELLITDSQSMCVEASILGTPSVRYSDFSGRISVLEELEHTYGLTYGIHTSKTGSFYNKIKELLRNENLKKEWHMKRDKMLTGKIDVTAFWTWIITYYPYSIQMLKDNPDYQDRFYN